MPASHEDKQGSFDVRYLRTLYDDLASSYKEQAESLSKLGANVAEINTLLKIFGKKQEDQDKILEKHSERIRSVERQQDGCEARSQIKGIWHHIKRLNAFKDMISEKATQDSGIIDLHAMRMQQSAEATLKDTVSFRGTLLKMLPWFIVVFAAGVALATLITFQTLSGRTIVQLPTPITNLSSPK